MQRRVQLIYVYFFDSIFIYINFVLLFLVQLADIIMLLK